MLQVGKVPETLRVREHIELFSSYYPDPLPRAEIVDVAGLRGLENRLFGELSGGQKQRLLFALAICGNPDLLILDEPTVGLDVDARRGIWEEIRRFVAKGGAVLLTTHYLQEADSLADRIIVIDRGRIIAEGTPAEIKARVSGKRIRCSTALQPQELTTLPFVTQRDARWSGHGGADIEQRGGGARAAGARSHALESRSHQCRSRRGLLTLTREVA